MRSFIDLQRTFGTQPLGLGVVLGRIDRGAGREDLYRDQVPELLRSLASQTRVESISASSAIEGVVVDPSRVGRLVGGNEVRFLNRSEQEFTGYRDATEIALAVPPERMSIPLVMSLHRALFRHTEMLGGSLKTEDNRIVSRDEHGIAHVLFDPPPWRQTEFLLRELVDRYNDAIAEQLIHPIVLIGAFILDFLSIHPFSDGNGRVARILTTQTLVARGYGIPNYVSVEKRIYETKDRYYDVLFAAQRNWHEGEHTIWPWVEYLAEILAAAYEAFEARVAAEQQRVRKLTKQERVRIHVLEYAPRTFTIDSLRQALPAISDQTIRLVLASLRREHLVNSDDSGRNATWVRIP
jgi:Fic family protein